MSERRLRRLIGLIALIGLAVAAYLTYVHYAELEPICAGGGGGCEKVQNSSYAELAGVPVAVLGLGGYALILASLWLPGDNGSDRRRAARARRLRLQRLPRLGSSCSRSTRSASGAWRAPC